MQALRQLSIADVPSMHAPQLQAVRAESRAQQEAAKAAARAAAQQEALARQRMLAKQQALELAAVAEHVAAIRAERDGPAARVQQWRRQQAAAFSSQLNTLRWGRCCCSWDRRTPRMLHVADVCCLCVHALPAAASACSAATCRRCGRHSCSRRLRVPVGSTGSTAWPRLRRETMSSRRRVRAVHVF